MRAETRQTTDASKKGRTYRVTNVRDMLSVKYVVSAGRDLHDRLVVLARDAMFAGTTCTSMTKYVKTQILSLYRFGTNLSVRFFYTIISPQYCVECLAGGDQGRMHVVGGRHFRGHDHVTARKAEAPVDARPQTVNVFKFGIVTQEHRQCVIG